MSSQSKVASGPPTRLTPFGYALAGALGGCFANAIVYPLDTIKTRIQAAEPESDEPDGGKADLSISGLVTRILREEGIAGLFHGFAATMLNTFSMQYAYFFFYSIVRGRYLRQIKRTLSTPEELLLGALAGALAQIFTIPVSVIATRQQVGQHVRRKKVHHDHPHYITTDGTEADEIVVPKDDSFIGVARQIVREEGVGGLWLGIKPGLVLTVNPAITYGVFERVKGALLLARAAAATAAGGAAEADAKLGPWMSFVVGATSKTLATVVTYPYIMAKIKIQARTADPDAEEEEAEQAAAAAESVPSSPSSTSSSSKVTAKVTTTVVPTGGKKRHHHPGAVDILLRIAKHEGIRGWYQGMGAQVIKAILSQGVLFVSKEKFEHWALAIMVLWWRIINRGGAR